MDKKDILELFLKSGVLLSPEEFEAVNENNYMHVLKEKTAGDLRVLPGKFRTHLPDKRELLFIIIQQGVIHSTILRRI